jgi:hypothetical protein
MKIRGWLLFVGSLLLIAGSFYVRKMPRESEIGYEISDNVLYNVTRLSIVHHITPLLHGRDAYIVFLDVDKRVDTGRLRESLSGLKGMVFRSAMELPEGWSRRDAEEGHEVKERVFVVRLFRSSPTEVVMNCTWIASETGHTYLVYELRKRWGKWHVEKVHVTGAA